ncbi:hypothetical protein HK098_005879 [Nowakowskiella sp. JEL0407]|nr:hypothetical protein HK098_005879 [Nowakowskiella sp. JEL0407]
MKRTCKSICEIVEGVVTEIRRDVKKEVKIDEAVVESVVFWPVLVVREVYGEVDSKSCEDVFSSFEILSSLWKTTLLFIFKGKTYQNVQPYVEKAVIESLSTLERLFNRVVEKLETDPNRMMILVPFAEKIFQSVCFECMKSKDCALKLLGEYCPKIFSTLSILQTTNIPSEMSCCRTHDRKIQAVVTTTRNYIDSIIDNGEIPMVDVVDGLLITEKLIGVAFYNSAVKRILAVPEDERGQELMMVMLRLKDVAVTFQVGIQVVEKLFQKFGGCDNVKKK